MPGFLYICAVKCDHTMFSTISTYAFKIPLLLHLTVVLPQVFRLWSETCCVSLWVGSKARHKHTTVPMPIFLINHFQLCLQKINQLRSFFSYTKFGQTGQKMRDRARMGSVSPAGAGNRVKVIRSSHFPCRSHHICDTDFPRWGKRGARQCPGPGNECQCPWAMAPGMLLWVLLSLPGHSCTNGLLLF